MPKLAVSRVLGSVVVAAFVLPSAFGCSSSDGGPPAPLSGAGHTSSAVDGAIRDGFVHAASMRSGMTAESAARLRSWSAKLDHDAICAGLEMARGDDALFWSTGVVVGRGAAEVVVDLRQHQAAVLTYGARGPRELLAGSFPAYQSISSMPSAAAGSGDVAHAWSGASMDRATPAPSSGIDPITSGTAWSRADGRGAGISTIVGAPPAAAKRLLVIDGSTFEEGYRVSDRATRALAESLPRLTHDLRIGNGASHLELRGSGDGVLTPGSATAAAIFALAGPSNARAAHAALVAVALERIARQGSAGIDGHCGSSGPAKAATRSIGVTLGGPDVEALLATMPEPPETSTEAAALPNAPSCINDESLACSGESTCAPIGGDNFCCRPPIPVTKVCFSDGDCGGPELCVPSGSQSSDGKTFTCASPNVSSCEATRSMVPMAPAGPNVADLRKQVDACINSVDYNNLKPRFAAAGETYTHRSGSTVWSVASYMGSAAGWLIDTAERSRAWVEYMTFGGTDAQAYLAGVITAVNGKIASGGWMNYQKVCIAQCISSRIIEYQQNALAKFGGVSTAVAQGVGVCTEFSAIMLRILESTAAPDVSASLGLSPGHAFVRVTFDGISYSVEPQNDPVSGGACTFYQ